MLQHVWVAGSERICLLWQNTDQVIARTGIQPGPVRQAHSAGGCAAAAAAAVPGLLLHARLGAGQDGPFHALQRGRAPHCGCCEGRLPAGKQLAPSICSLVVSTVFWGNMHLPAHFSRTSQWAAAMWTYPCALVLCQSDCGESFSLAEIGSTFT